MSNGTEMRDKCSYPENTIFNIGIPRVRDLCVEQNITATVSAAVKPDFFLVEMKKVKNMKLS